MNLSGAGLPFAGGPLHFAQCRLFGRNIPAEILGLEAAERRAPGELESLRTPRPAIAGLEPAKSGPGPLIMGIVNVTPDSFHDGGRLRPAAAIAHGRALAGAGAAILDVGGESTRPGAREVPVDEELERIMPVIEALAGDGLAVSVDTRKAAVMTAAVNAGARMINDVTALRHDPGSMACAAKLAVPVVLMHSRGTPETMQSMTHYDDLIMDVFDDLSARLADCLAAGLSRDNLLLDPGLGFAKMPEQSAALLRGMAHFHALGCPLLIGASRKGFVGKLTGAAATEDRLPGSLAAAMWAAQQGAAVLRVHDVAETAQTMAIFRSLCYKG
ncbi:MAG: dihydropteroate synthase [Alphaproteobacteria bacterium]|nr:dihydropteroate synthase [Alphaproteobacteria bacterium]